MLIDILGIVFLIAVPYAVLGNLVVYSIVLRRKVPASFMWAGMPGYLYRVCVDSPSIGHRLRWFALTPNIAFVIAMVAGIILMNIERR